MTTITRSISLYSDHNGSDKVYNIQIVEEENGFKVNFQNGKQGGTLTSGTKTKIAVSIEAATKIFEKLQKEKTNGSSHYRPIDAVAGAYIEPVDRALSGSFPQLLTTVPEESLPELFKNSKRVLQQKYDGERLQTIFTDTDIQGSNKLGFLRGIPQGVKDVLASCIGTDFDGEIVGNTYYVFDITRFNGVSLKELSYASRLVKLEEVFQNIPENTFVIPVKTYRTTEEKERAFQLIKQGHGEGVVFKDTEAMYLEGRSKVAFKYKFTESATCFVTAFNTNKDSVRYGLTINGVDTELGSVSVPSKHTMPPVGALIEIHYLYAFPKTHALSQAVYKGPRLDQEKASCTVDQLKYKTTFHLDDEDDQDETISPTPAPKKRSTKMA